MMQKRYSILFAFALVLSLSAFAQGGSNRPEKGSFTMSLVLGSNDVSEINPRVLPDYAIAYQGRVDYFNLVQPMQAENNFSTKSPSSITNIAGVNLRYFLSDHLSWSLFGSYGYSNTPGNDAMIGVPPLYDTKGDVIYGTGIPAINAVTDQNSSQLYLSSGLNYHIRPQVGSAFMSNLDFFVGGRFNFVRNFLEKTNFTWLEYDANTQDYKLEGPSAGAAQARAIGMGGSLVAGADYYITSSFYLGAEFNVANFMYTETEVVAQPGLNPAQSHTTFLNAFSYPRFKIGFRLF